MNSFFKKYRNLSISSKLILLQSIIFLVIASLLILISSSFMRSFFKKSEEANLIQTNQQVLDMIEVYDLSLKQNAIRTAKIFSLLTQGREMDSISLEQIDFFSKTTNTIATIFRKEGNEFLRIKTSLLKTDGTRAIGTTLDKSHPAYPVLLEKKTYVGKAKLFGKDYMTSYEPIVENGVYKGVRFIGIDITNDLKDLKDKIRKIKIGITGYTYVISSNPKDKGLIIVHPAKEETSLQNVKSADGIDFVAEFLKKNSGTLYYSWINSELGEKIAREKVTAFHHYKDWDWIIVTGGYVSEIIENGTILITILSIGLGITFLVLLGILKLASDKVVRNPLHSLVLIMDSISNGELRMKQEDISHFSGDEIGLLGIKLNQYTIKIKGIISKIQTISKKLSESSAEMHSTSEVFTESAQSQSSNSEEVTAALEEISASMERMASLSHEQFTNLSKMLNTSSTLSSMISNIEKTINESVRLSDQVSKNASAGSKSISQMKENMEKIMLSSNSITGIVKIIRDISKQINLLALNAAIEAARAGEMGKGFAVVADEVSKLADETARSIKNIDSLILENKEEIERGITGVTVSTQAIVDMIKDIQKIKTISSDIANQMSSQIAVNQSVTSEAELVGQRSDEINTATIEQKNAIAEILSSVSVMNEMIQVNSIGARGISDSSRSIADMASTMKEEISFFKID